MKPITSGRMKIIPTLEKDGYALPGGEKALKDTSIGVAFRTSRFMGQELTTEQRKYYIEHGGMGYAKHDA